MRTWQELRPRPAIKPECLLVHGQITLRGPGNSPIQTGPRLFIDLKRICPAALLNRVMATPDNRPQLKTCPSCGITMVLSKSRPSTITVDTWKCLRCDFEIAVRPPEPDDPKAGP